MPQRVRDTLAGQLATHPELIRETFGYAGGEHAAEAGEFAIRLFNGYAEVHAAIDEQPEGRNWYSFPAREAMTDMLSAYGGLRQLRYQPERCLPAFAVMATNLSTIADLTTSLLAWDIRRAEMRPDMPTLTAEALITSFQFSELSRELKHEKDRGPMMDRLEFGACERDCTHCPLAFSLTMSQRDYILAWRVHCPMFTSRLACCYEPFYTRLTFGAKAAFTSVMTQGTTDPQACAFLFSGGLTTFKLRLLAAMLDCLPREAEDSMTLVYANGRARQGIEGMATSLIMMRGINTPMPWMEDVLM